MERRNSRDRHEEGNGDSHSLRSMAVLVGLRLSCARLDKTAMLRRLRLTLSLACVAGDLAASAVGFWQRSRVTIGNKLRRDSHLSLASNGRSAAKKVPQAQ